MLSDGDEALPEKRAARQAAGGMGTESAADGRHDLLQKFRARAIDNTDRGRRRRHVQTCKMLHGSPR